MADATLARLDGDRRVVSHDEADTLARSLAGDLLTLASSGHDIPPPRPSWTRSSDGKPDRCGVTSIAVPILFLIGGLQGR